ncbi:sulfatase-like hydrolase/transferase [Pontiella sulfatireligans]|uniref:Arylsulfatase n=1 Tax=Pontiella sulfatireligans TaxID=2750658 RepID=A0A6C2UPB5_9BACT|nr:sulfatase-like hydrolase/transferase [Pontiella sulfatireligans]SPS74457.1 sulfatase S1_51 [Kiritimatiellales bacterium]VGO20856.1 Arylsulfatase [Pontiella sulfatireligans]
MMKRIHNGSALVAWLLAASAATPLCAEVLVDLQTISPADSRSATFSDLDGTVSSSDSSLIPSGTLSASGSLIAGETFGFTISGVSDWDFDVATSAGSVNTYLSGLTSASIAGNDKGWGLASGANEGFLAAAGEALVITFNLSGLTAVPGSGFRLKGVALGRIGDTDAYNYMVIDASGDKVAASASGRTSENLFLDIALNDGDSLVIGREADDFRVAAFTVDVPAPPVSPPTDVIAIGGDARIDLSWTAPGGAVLGYEIDRSTTSGSGFSSLTNVATTSFTDLGLTNGQTYYYLVSAVYAETNVAAAEVSAQPIEPAPANSPNIIFFIVDDQVKDEVACYGGQVLTPHLDRLAAEGMRMDAAHVVANVCTPSRYSMFTGRYPGNSYWPEYLEAYPTNRHGSPEFNVGLEDDNMNVGNALRLAGYVTGHVGKLHVGAHGLSSDVFSADDDPEDPAVIAKWQARELSTRQWVLERGFSWAKHVYSGNIDDPYNKHNPDWILEAALEFIGLNQNRPFYLHYCTTMMHGGPNNWTDALDYPLYSGAGLLAEPPDVPISRSSISALVDAAGFDSDTYGFTWMDATVGAMLDKLDALGIASNTFFVFISDHGTDGKFSLLDHNGTSVPCIIRWPDVVPAGSVCSNLVQNTDMVPTFFDVAGAAVPEGYRIDGTSIAPIFSDPSTNVHEHIFFEMGYGRAVRTDKWKYTAVRHGSDRFADIEAAKLLNMPRDLAYVGNMKRVSSHLELRPDCYDLDQLYDLENDPLEMTNLAYNVAYEEQLNTMKAILTLYLEAQGRPFGEFVPGEDSVPIEQVQPYVDQLELVRPIDNDFEYVYSINGTPYWWLYEQELTNDAYEVEDLLDTDGDGLVAWEEYIVGTIPTQAGSGLTVAADVQPLGGGFVVRWPSVAGRIYTVEQSTNLLSGFQTLTNVVATPPENTCTGTVQQAGAYYRVQAEME